MRRDEKRAAGEEMWDVRRAAAASGRHPETVRRWVWSGRLAARRQGNRLLVARADVEALTASRATPVDLATWAERAHQAARDSAGGRSGRSAADLVLADRAARAR